MNAPIKTFRDEIALAIYLTVRRPLMRDDEMKRLMLAAFDEADEFMLARALYSFEAQVSMRYHEPGDITKCINGYVKHAWTIGGNVCRRCGFVSDQRARRSMAKQVKRVKDHMQLVVNG